MATVFLSRSSILLCVSILAVPALRAEDEHVFRETVDHIWRDQKRMISAPLRANRVDFVIWGTTAGSLLYLAPKWGQERSVDQRIEQSIDRSEGSWNNFMKSYTHVGDAGVLFGASLGTYGLSTWQKWPKTRTGSLHTFEALADSGIAAQIIKILAGRRRPVDHPSNGPFLGPWGYFGDSENDSFVSGHAAMTFAAATVISHESRSYYVGIPAYMVAGSISYSRLYVERHWLSDLIGGAALGYSVGIMVENHRHSKPRLAGHFSPYIRDDAVGIAWNREF